MTISIYILLNNKRRKVTTNKRDVLKEYNDIQLKYRKNDAKDVSILIKSSSVSKYYTEKKILLD